MNVNELERISGCTFFHMCSFLWAKVATEALGERISDSLKRQSYCFFPRFILKQDWVHPYLLKSLKIECRELIKGSGSCGVS